MADWQTPDWADKPVVPQSKYNSGLLKVQRLNDNWIRCREFWRAGDWVALNEELKMAWIELEADSTDEHRKIITQMKRDFINILTKEKNLIVRKQRLFDLLERKWIYLFQVEKEQGLGKSYINPEEDDWD